MDQYNRAELPNQPVVRTTAAKAWVAAVGATLTAASTAVATVSVAVGDDAIDAVEVGSIATALIVLVGTVWRVWATRNEPTT